MSATLFGFYQADMPHRTELVKRICYADDITVCALGVKISKVEHMIKGYLTEMSCFLQDNSLLISAPKSAVFLFTPDPMQANTHPKIRASSCSQSKVTIWIPSFHLMLIVYKSPTESVKETMS